jgi:hypothetical protein
MNTVRRPIQPRGPAAILTRAAALAPAGAARRVERMDSMMTKPAIQIEQPLFDYRELGDDSGYVKERALRIRDVAKRTAEGIILIGQWLTEVKARIPHGGWLPWLESEFGWSERTARNFMQVHSAFKSATFADLEIDVSALYLIAAPKTPEPVRQEVIRRAEAGEPMTHAKAVEVLEAHKAQAKVPTPAVARQIAIATGVPTAASSGVYVLPMSQEDEDALGMEQGAIRDLYDAIEILAETDVTPQEMVVLGKKHACRFLSEWSVVAAKWLSRVAEEANASTTGGKL